MSSNSTVLTLSFKSLKKMVVIDHVGELGYDDVVSSGISQFSINEGPIVLYDAITECEIPFDIFSTYIKQILNSNGILHIKIVPIDFQNVELQNHEFSSNLLEIQEKESEQIIFEAQSSSNSTGELDIIEIINKHCLKLIKKINSSLVLTPSERNELSSTIIKQKLNSKPSKSLNKEDFIQLSLQIVNVFPQEVSETYYIPSTGSIIAKGKLYNCYHNYRGQINRAGVIRRRSRSSTTSSTTSAADSEITNLDTIDTEIEDDIEYVKLNVPDSTDEFAEKWRKTHKFRQNLLRSSMPTIEYIELFPGLKSSEIKKLMEIDLKIKYTDFDPDAIRNWHTIYPNIIQRANKINRDSVVKSLCQRIEAAEEAEKSALAFLVLPYIFPVNGKRTYGNGRVSKIEIQHSFISLYKTAVEAFEAEAIPEAPKVIFVGNPISIAYVLVAGERYMYCNPVEAVECCFYLYMGLNIKYPIACKSIWHFIQKGIFKIKTEFDENIPCVLTLINDMQSNN